MNLSAAASPHYRLLTAAGEGHSTRLVASELAIPALADLAKLALKGQTVEKVEPQARKQPYSVLQETAKLADQLILKDYHGYRVGSESGGFRGAISTSRFHSTG